MTRAEAVLLAREHLAMFRAWEIIADAVEAAGDVAGVVRRLEEERALLELEVDTLKREKERRDE